MDVQIISDTIGCCGVGFGSWVVGRESVIIRFMFVIGTGVPTVRNF